MVKKKLDALASALDSELGEDRKLIAKRPPGPIPRSIDPIIFSEELKYLNSSWSNWSNQSDFSSHRPIVGKFISFFKRKIQAYLFNVIFKDYIEREREFVMKLVQYSNLTANYIDHRNEKIFWELNQKLDREIEMVSQRNDILISELLKNKTLNNPES